MNGVTESVNAWFPNSRLGAAVLTSALSAGLWARDLYVNPDTGDDKANGLAAAASAAAGPVRSIAQGIRLARPGDTVRLGGATYKGRREQVGFYGRSGEAGAPIVLDGQGATIDGCEPLEPGMWQAVAPGLYRSDTLYRDCFHSNDEYVARAYFLFNGKMNRMGRSLKGPKPPYKPPEALQPGEWTYQADTRAFFVRIDSAQSLAEARIEVPWVTTGVQVSGDCHDLVIRNVRAAHVLNDGFGITVGGASGSLVRRVRFENIEAFECGDDGLSAHGDCEVFVDGFLSQRNGTGICTCGTSYNNRVVIREAHGLDLDLYAGPGPHVFSNSVIVCHGIRPVTVMASTKGAAGTNESCALVLDNVLVCGRAGGPAGSDVIRVQARTSLAASRCTFADLSFTAWPGAAVELRGCVLAGGGKRSVEIPANAVWRAERNLYDLQQIRLGGRVLSAQTFAAEAAAGAEPGCDWRPVPDDAWRQAAVPLVLGGAPVGVDLRLLPEWRGAGGGLTNF